MRIFKKSLVALACALGLSVLVGAAAQTSVTASATTSTTVEYSFESTNELNDFTSVYVSTEGGTGGTIGNLDTYWKQDTAAGKVTSLRTNSGNGSTNEIVALALTKYQFTNFEAEVVMDFEADSSWGWGGLQFRKTVINTGWRADGCFAFAQMQGQATIWGSDDFDNTTIEQAASGSFNKNSPFLLTVKVVGQQCDMKISSTDKATTYASLSYSFKKSESVKSGFLALQSVDNSHNFYSLKVTNLNSQGQAIALQETAASGELTIDKSTTALTVGKPHQLTFLQSEVDNSLITWTVADKDVAVVKNGWVTGLKAGSTKITATSVSNASVKDEITLTFSEETGSFVSFSKQTAINQFDAAFVASRIDDSAGKEPFENHWTWTENGTIKRTNVPVNNYNSDENFANLYFKNLKYRNFEATLAYRNTNGLYGWIGFTSGTTAYNKRCMDDGIGYFVQKEGKATAWGSANGLYEGSAGSYGITDWHVLRVRVYGGNVKMYIDDMSTPMLETSYSSGINEGYVGIMTTCVAEFEISGVGIVPLDNNGNEISYSGISAISFKNKITTAKVGDSLKLEAVATGEGDVPALEYVSSDNNVAFINNGLVHFISEGEVTITVMSYVDLRLTDSMTIEVTKDEVDKDYTYVDGTHPNPDIGGEDTVPDVGSGDEPTIPDDGGETPETPNDGNQGDNGGNDGTNDDGATQEPDVSGGCNSSVLSGGLICGLMLGLCVVVKRRKAE